MNPSSEAKRKKKTKYLLVVIHHPYEIWAVSANIKVVL